MSVLPSGDREMMPSVDKAAITPALVSRLVADQFPQWADLPVRPVELDGWDNATFRLGEDMSVRLPSGGQYALQAGGMTPAGLPVTAVHQVIDAAALDDTRRAARTRRRVGVADRH